MDPEIVIVEGWPGAIRQPVPAPAHPAIPETVQDISRRLTVRSAVDPADLPDGDGDSFLDLRTIVKYSNRRRLAARAA